MLEKKKIDFELQEDEVVRLSLRKNADSPTGYILVAKGDNVNFMLSAITQYLKEQFNLVCIPEQVLKQLGFEIVEITDEDAPDDGSKYLS